MRIASLLAGSAGVTAVVAACGGAPASPTAAPKAAEPTKPAAAAPTTAPAAAPTTAPAAKPAEPTKPAAAATTAPAAAPTTAPAAAKPGEVANVPRNRTLRIGSLGDSKWKDFDLWNPYAVGANHQTGSMLLYEPLAYYSAFADKNYYWLAESHQFSPDFKTLTIKTRSGITWSDGTPFSAADIAYTYSALKDLGPKVRWGADVQQFVESATTTDANTAVIKFKVPAPRFFFYSTYKFDIGIYPVPKHIFEKQDWTSYKAYDPAKGEPVTTGPWKVVSGTPDAKIMDRRPDWWAVKAGLAQLPKPERLVWMTGFQEQQLVTSLISNELDFCMPIVNSYKAILPGNPNVTTFAGRKPNFGYKDWWPLSLYINTEKKPFDDPEVRWALSYFLNRKQIIEVSYEGANEASRLPMPDYPPLKPYFDVVKDLLEKYDTNAFDAAKGTELLTKKGWKKNGNQWVDTAGQPVKMEVLGFPFLSALGPVVAQQLKNQGIDATYAMPPNAGQLFEKGEYTACLYGHGGSVSDPYETLRLYQSSSVALPGSHQSNFSRWKNADYDKIVDDVYVTPMEDKQKLQGLFRKAMEIWLPNLPDIQLVHLYHTIARNETYWKGWPTEQDPYVNEASWHLTWQLVLNKIQPTQ
jgi:peptide/nickel transport system substrate-binding protein